MDYKKYFTRLLQKSNEISEQFPRNHHFTHRENNYYADALSYNGVRFNYVISSNRSRTYGESFVGLIVELYIYKAGYVDSYFEQLKQYKEKIENEIGDEDIVWQSKKETPSENVSRVYARKAVDIDDESKWDEYIDWQVNTMVRFLEVFPKYVDDLKEIKEVGMTEQQLIDILKKMYEEAANGQQVGYIHLFGIKYADKLKGKDLKKIARIATGKESYSTEISKGIKLRTLLEKENFYESNIKKRFIPTGNLKNKNILLYGVPGVGKTHNITKLIRLIEEGKSDNEIFLEIQNNTISDVQLPDDLKERTAFVTFHQSFGYEDFIEGFRPNEEGNIELVDGVFKRLANQARENFVQSQSTNTVSFQEALHRLLKEKIETGETVKIDLKRTNSYYLIYDYNDRTIFFEKQNGDKSHSLSIRTLERMYREERNDIIQGGLAPYYNPLLDKLLEIKHSGGQTTVERKNYYLVIDEINRGNISKIFGELITLIEEDKRDGLEVTLPYSKEPFSVPSNLYIIGTMNSTDKSIALIDVALRRRFTFLKMEPKPELIEHQKAKEVFETLNEFLKERLDEDHQIGHSYFMKIQDEDDLNFVLDYKIKPLLEEYFYGDREGLNETMKLLETP